MLLERLRPRTRTKHNPLFYAERFRLLAGDPDRAGRALSEPASVDLLTWNVFASLDSDSDRGYLAHLLEPLGGPGLAAPVRISLLAGRHHEPLLRPSPAYVRHLRERVGGGEESIAEFLRPVEAPVRIDSPGVLVLAETTLGALARGAGGRDRLVELVDTGLEQARYLSKELTVALVYSSGTRAAADLSARVNRLRDPQALAAALPWREQVPPVAFREVSWQDLLATWERERDNLRLSGQPVRDFLAYCTALGLR